jgi:hypothetical protein
MLASPASPAWHEAAASCPLTLRNGTIIPFLQAMAHAKNIAQIEKGSKKWH